MAWYLVKHRDNFSFILPSKYKSQWGILTFILNIFDRRLFNYIQEKCLSLCSLISIVVPLTEEQGQSGMKNKKEYLDSAGVPNTFQFNITLIQALEYRQVSYPLCVKSSFPLYKAVGTWKWPHPSSVEDSMPETSLCCHTSSCCSSTTVPFKHGKVFLWDKHLH
jgi:hypothetical protein